MIKRNVEMIREGDGVNIAGVTEEENSRIFEYFYDICFVIGVVEKAVIK
ncbi:MAG: hypothetical protein LBD84_02125 [Campylobacteraceae bacterium]|jgi:hypothetical protein|nr:hypothetical protein [Campylobacteraceae bacterium]